MSDFIYRVSSWGNYTLCVENSDDQRVVVNSAVKSFRNGFGVLWCSLVISNNSKDESWLEDPCQ